MKAQLQKWFGGLVGTAIGVGLIAFSWYFALHQDKYFPKLAFMGPFFTVCGIAICLLPPDAVIKKTTAGKECPTGLGCVVMVIGFVCGGLYCGMFEFGWFLRGF